MKNKIQLLKEIEESVQLKNNLIKIEPQINQAIKKIFITFKIKYLNNQLSMNEVIN